MLSPQKPLLCVRRTRCKACRYARGRRLGPIPALRTRGRNSWLEKPTRLHRRTCLKVPHSLSRKTSRALRVSWEPRILKLYDTQQSRRRPSLDHTRLHLHRPRAPDAPPRIAYRLSATSLLDPRRLRDASPNHRLDASGAVLRAFLDPAAARAPLGPALPRGPKNPAPEISTAAQLSPAATAVAVAVLDFMGHQLSDAQRYVLLYPLLLTLNTCGNVRTAAPTRRVQVNNRVTTHRRSLFCISWPSWSDLGF